MSDIDRWSTSAAANNATAPDGAPEGWAPSAVNDTIRELMAAAARWYRDQKGELTSTGSGGVYGVVTNNSYNSLGSVPIIAWRANHANSGTATLQINALGARNVRKYGRDLYDNELRTGQLALVAYNALSDFYELITNTVATTKVGKNFAEHSTTASMQYALSITPQAATVLAQSSTASMQLTLGISPQAAGVLAQSSTASMQYNLGITPQAATVLAQSSTASMQLTLGISPQAAGVLAQSSTASMQATLDLGPTSEIQYSKAHNFSAVALTQPAGAGTTVTWILSGAQVASIRLSGNWRMDITAQRAGGVYVLFVNQNATGNYTLAFPATVTKWENSSAPTISVSPSATDALVFLSDGTFMHGKAFGQNFK